MFVESRNDWNRIIYIFSFFVYLSNFKPLKNHVLIHILVRSIPLHYTLYILTNNIGKQVFVSGDPLDLKVYHTIKDIFLYLRVCSVGWVFSNFKRKSTCIYRISLIQILFLLFKHADSYILAFFISIFTVHCCLCCSRQPHIMELHVKVCPHSSLSEHCRVKCDYIMGIKDTTSKHCRNSSSWTAS